ncbi:hypothetical protein [Tropicibacter sp. S64]|uniref:hypothetical protein n=1 Tax=Tropicibacter sp. S64 TaxID=3415122 RepID=UPI003C7B6CD2
MSEIDYHNPFTWFRGPLGGDVVQNISPAFTNVDIAGNVDVERRVVREVASYGDQLGTILDVVAMLAKNLDQTDPRVVKLLQLKQQVDAIVEQEEAGAVRRAEKALDALEKVKPEKAEEIIRRRRPEL